MKQPCSMSSNPTDPNSSADNESSSITPSSLAPSELVEHVEECELDAMELLLKSLYKADPDLPEEARGNGHLLLQVRSDKE